MKPSRPVISLSHKGSFTKTEKFFEELANIAGVGKLDKYGKMGVQYLSEATPKDTGLTASSWYYTIDHDKDGATIILQYGHATKNGGWVEGIDYINPALRPVFDKMAEEASKEVFGIL